MAANTRKATGKSATNKHTAVAAGPISVAAPSSQPSSTCARVMLLASGVRAGSSAEIAGRLVTIAVAATTAAANVSNTGALCQIHKAIAARPAA